jgi:hypothetical protein
MYNLLERGGHSPIKRVAAALARGRSAVLLLGRPLESRQRDRGDKGVDREGNREQLRTRADLKGVSQAIGVGEAEAVVRDEALDVCNWTSIHEPSGLRGTAA